VSGPTFWFQGVNFVVYAINANTGKEELNFSDFTGLSMVAGNGPSSNYAGQIGATNIVINQQLGILVSSMTSRGYSNTGRGFFAGWNLNANPPSMKWITYTTPPQPQSNVPLNPYFDQQLIANMTGAETFYPGENGSTNGYTTKWEVAGGVLHNVNDDIVVNWKNLPAAELNASLYNDWGYFPQTAQCQAISGGASTGGTGAGWGAQWLVGSGQTAGMFIVATNNADPYSGPCYPGPDLWSATTLALNATTGQIIWGFQANAHDIWDYDCSWYQGLGNETINGVNTEVVLKTCKNGYLYELNAVTGNLIWAWDPPSGVVNPGPSRCSVCYMLNPLNESQMHFDFPSAMTNCAPTFTLACITGPQPDFFGFPPALAGFEDEQAFDPATNQIYATSHLVPAENHYVPQNTSNYGSDEGFKSVPCPACGSIANNASVWDINAANGQVIWNHLIPNQGFRGQTDVSGNVVFLTLSSADILMLNAQTGQLVRDYYMGAPMDVGVSIGASISGQEYILVPVGTCSFEAVSTCPGSTPGDVVALALQSYPPPPASTTTVTTTTTLPGQTITTTLPGGQVVTTTITGTATTVTLSGSGTVTSVSTTTVTSSSNSTALYGVAAVAVIFIIVSGYLAMTRGRKPAS
jgi:PQQ enzyme repeat